MGAADDGATELIAGEVAIWAGGEIGASELEFGCAVEKLGNELEDDGGAGVEATEAASWWVHALAAASTVPAVRAALRPRRPRHWLATSRG